MINLFQKWKIQIGVADSVSEVKRMKNWSDFEKLARVKDFSFRYQRWINRDIQFVSLNQLLS